MKIRDNLIRHYNEKYQSDGSSKSLEIINYTKLPGNRFETCLKFFIENFFCGKILELGAGNGILLNSFINYNLKFSNYAISDFSETRIQAIKNNITDERVEVLVLDVEELPIDHMDKYDAIIIIALIEHLVDPIRVLQNIKKLLNPGGFVFINTPNFAKLTRRLKLLLGKFPSTASKNEGLTTYENKPVDLHDEGHLHYFTFRSLSLILNRCGFNKIEKVSHYSGPHILGKFADNFLANLYPALFSDLTIVAYVY